MICFHRQNDLAKITKKDVGFYLKSIEERLRPFTVALAENPDNLSEAYWITNLNKIITLTAKILHISYDEVVDQILAQEVT